ncbi:MAG: uroporphyrinogen decarboxylase family protein [Spirochaetia bacterium]
MRYLVENSILRSNEKAIKAKIESLGEDGLVIPRIERNPYQKIMIELAGAEQYFFDLYRNPDSVLSLMDAIDRKIDEQISFVMQSKAEAVWQPDNVTSDLTPPYNYETFLLPRYEKIGSQLKDAGKIYVVHMDGRLKALKNLVAGSRFDVLDSFSLPVMGGDISVTEAVETFLDKTLCPNFPSSLAESPDEEINSFITQLKIEFGRDTPYMIQISEDLPESSYGRIYGILSERLP